MYHLWISVITDYKLRKLRLFPFSCSLYLDESSSSTAHPGKQKILTTRLALNDQIIVFYPTLLFVNTDGSRLQCFRSSLQESPNGLSRDDRWHSTFSYDGTRDFKGSYPCWAYSQTCGHCRLCGVSSASLHKAWKTLLILIVLLTTSSIRVYTEISKHIENWLLIYICIYLFPSLAPVSPSSDMLCCLLTGNIPQSAPMKSGSDTRRCLMINMQNIKSCMLRFRS